MERNVGEEGLVAIVFALEPSIDFVGQQQRRIAFDFSQRLAIANEISRVEMRGFGVVFRSQGIVEALVDGLRLIQFWILRQATQVPLADVHRLIALRLEHLGDGDFAVREMHGVIRGPIAVHAGAGWHATGHNADARGRAIWGPGVGVLEFYAASGQRVQMRRKGYAAVGSQVDGSHVVGQEDENIGGFCGFGIQGEDEA